MAEAKRSLAAVIPEEALFARPCAIFRSRAASALACVECDCFSTCPYQESIAPGTYCFADHHT